MSAVLLDVDLEWCREEKGVVAELAVSQKQNVRQMSQRVVRARPVPSLFAWIDFGFFSIF